jgi:ribosome-associated protein
MASEETRRQLLVAVAACDDKKGEDTRILELDPQDSGLADFFLITSATNDRQVVAIADEIEFRLKKEFGLYATSVEGRKQGEWVLLDYVDIVIHVFLAEKRAFYDIERLRKSARNLTSADVEAELTSALKKKTIAVREGAPAGKKAAKKAVKAVAKKSAVKKAAGKSPATKTATKAVALKTPKGGAALAKKAAKKAVTKTAAKKAVVKKAAVPAKKTALKKAVVPAKKAALKSAVVKPAVVKPAAVKAALKKAAVKTAPVKKAAVKEAPVAAPKVLGAMAPDSFSRLGAKPPILKTEAPAMFVDQPPVDLAANAEASAAPKKAAAKKSKK